jgi:uncharacterized protein DUF262
MKISITKVPQADELAKVIMTVEAVYNNFRTDQQIADYVGFTDRQGRYYRLATEILGLVENRGNNGTLTTEGEELIVLDEEHRQKRIRTILRDNALFSAILNYIESSEDGRSRSELSEFLGQIIEGAESTIARRYFTIFNWLTNSGLLILDIREISEGEKETVYKLNDQLDEDDFIEPSNFNDSIYPATYSDEELDIKETHMQVISLLRKKNQSKILVPEFQRNQVWKQQQKSRFIESLILNIPVPPFYISQDLEGIMIVIDGLQRSTAIFEFLADSYHLVGLEALPHLNGKSYTDLDTEIRARIEDRELLLYILKPSVPMSVVYDIFYRINSNGTPLNRQEIRNCIYIGNSTRLLDKLSNSEVFKNAINKGIPALRMKDREAILRFIAFSNPNALEEYKSDMDDYLGKIMRRLNRMTEADILVLENRFSRVMRLTYDFFGENIFRLPTENSKGRINIALMEAIMVFFERTPDDILQMSRNVILDKYYNVLLRDSEFRDSIRNSTNSEKNVKTRFRKVFQILTP